MACSSICVEIWSVSGSGRSINDHKNGKQKDLSDSALDNYNSGF